MTDAVISAIEKAGGSASLARKLNINRASVHEWKKNRHVPAGRVLSIEKITGVSRHELRPDLYPVDSPE